MEVLSIELYKAADAEDSFAIRLATDPPDQRRAETGFGKHFEKVWSLEVQSDDRPSLPLVNWDAVLERAIEAFNLSDPVITNFDWPSLQAT